MRLKLCAVSCWPEDCVMNVFREINNHEMQGEFIKMLNRSIEFWTLSNSLGVASGMREDECKAWIIAQHHRNHSSERHLHCTQWLSSSRDGLAICLPLGAYCRRLWNINIEFVVWRCVAVEKSIRILGDVRSDYGWVFTWKSASIECDFGWAAHLKWNYSPNHLKNILVKLTEGFHQKCMHPLLHFPPQVPEKSLSKSQFQCEFDHVPSTRPGRFHLFVWIDRIYSRRWTSALSVKPIDWPWLKNW